MGALVEVQRAAGSDIEIAGMGAVAFELHRSRIHIGRAGVVVCHLDGGQRVALLVVSAAVVEGIGAAEVIHEGIEVVGIVPGTSVVDRPAIEQDRIVVG